MYVFLHVCMCVCMHVHVCMYMCAVASHSRAGPIAAGVVVGGMALIAIVTTFVVGVACFAIKEKNRTKNIFQ